MRRRLAIYFLTLIVILGMQAKPTSCQTYCNPLTLSSQSSSGQPLNLDLDDPTVVLYKDNYFLFATNAGGYWFSGDLLLWKFVSAPDLPLENSQPTAAVIDGWLYFFTSNSGKMFRSKDPANGKWEAYGNSLLLSQINDFAIFADTNGKVYCYYGCTNNDGVMARELDANNRLEPLGVPIVCKETNPLKKSLKKAKNNPDKADGYSVKGSWMNKYNGKYYYQCAELNKEFNNYTDVVYVSDSPTGPFAYAANNPFSFRPEGFVSGGSNGSTFADKYGNWWHIATIRASGNQKNKSRLGLFPAGFDKDGNLFAKTDFGDYPIIMPNQKSTNIDKLDPEWALLSDKLTAQASSSLITSPVTSAFDENLRTYWSAQTGKKGEWLALDLGSVCTVNAFQLFFPENTTQIAKADTAHTRRYLIEYSIDRKIWKKLSDKTKSIEFQTNPYEEVKIPIQARYLKITNYRVPDGNFAISDLRIFGSGSGHKPKKVNEFRAIRDYRDPQAIKISWEKQRNTTGYNIRYGADKDKLYHSLQVYKNTRLTIHCPDKKKIYWFQVDAFNENGVTPGKPLQSK
jgi:xylan 1,4-beta-xylosidase